ncbi:MAG: transcription termination/antitermination protein NusG, partial [Oscillospiraceae bacterium]
VRNTRGVTGFVGPSSKPVPLSQAEVDALGVDVKEFVIDYEVGSNVEITDGALKGFIAIVENIDTENRKVKAKVNMFGRETVAELEISQVKPV